MKQLVYYYDKHDTFLSWVKEHKIKNSDRLLIEINFSDSDQERLKKLLKNLKKKFSKATIVGMQSFTSFINHRVTDLNTQPIISIIEFETSTLSSLVIDVNKHHLKGEEQKPDLLHLEEYLQPDTKALEILSSYNESNTSAYMNELGSAFGHLKVFGGGSSNTEYNSQNTFVFYNGTIYKKAVILIFMHGDNLNVELFKTFDWKPISKKKKITKIENENILTIDKSPALDIYKKYFPNIEENPSVFLQVPLYVTKNNISYTANILASDSLTQSVNSTQTLQEGDVVQLSIGNYNAMMNRIQEIYTFLSHTPAQALWIGACISYEYGFRIPIIHYLSNIKSNNHIFGYSTIQEYFNTENEPHTSHNHTFIIAAISESNSSYIELKEYTDKNITPFEVANKNLYSIMHRTANELNLLTENLENMVNQRTKQLETLNQELQVKINNAVRKEKRQNAIMNQQSRLASMGEILENIAHQWRQPLNTVSWIMNDAMIKAQLGKSDEINLQELAQKVNNSVQFLSDTIEDFRRFVDHSDLAQTFNIKRTIDSTILLIKETLVKSNIKIELDCPTNIKYKGFENDLKHVIMNLINNARDAFEERKINDGLIFIRVYHEKDELIIAVRDNAGGIPKPILKNIFEPYFTTKHKTKGTGLGLYMSKSMIERVKGSIEAVSILNKKTTFIIKLPDKGAIPSD